MFKVVCSISVTGLTASSNRANIVLLPYDGVVLSRYDDVVFGGSSETRLIIFIVIDDSAN